MLRISLVTAGLLVSSAVSSAPAALLLSQNFDDTDIYSTATTGTVGDASTVGGQWGPFNPTANVSPSYLHGPRITTSQAASGAQSAQLVRDTFETSNLFSTFSSIGDSAQFELSYSLYQPLTGNAGVVVRLGNASVASQSQLGILLQTDRRIHAFNGVTWVAQGSAVTNAENNDWVHIRHVVDATNPAAATMDLYYSVGSGAEQHVGQFNVGAIIEDIHRLQFNAQGNNQANESVFIDNVRLNVVPEPAAVSLLATGGLLLLRRTRRLQAQ